MRRKLLVALSLVVFVTPSAFAQSRAKTKWQNAEARTITLFSRARYQKEDGGYGKSAFSFRHGVRSDVGYDITGNRYELVYGSISFNGDSDWFSVSMGTASRIKDLGELKWSDLNEVPFLAASASPQRGVRSPSPTETFEESSNGQVTRIWAGHVYVLHNKDRDTDFYTLFRVDNLVPSDQVTISWKVVPSPKDPAR
jgi:hypothetical protein